MDGDRGINNAISYSITRGAHGVFDIDSNTGVVLTLQKLDREGPLTNNGAYILEIMVRSMLFLLIFDNAYVYLYACSFCIRLRKIPC